MSNKDGDFTPKEALEKQKIDLPKEGEKKPRKQSMTHINILTAFTKTLQPKVEFKFDKVIFRNTCRKRTCLRLEYVRSYL